VLGAGLSEEQTDTPVLANIDGTGGARSPAHDYDRLLEGTLVISHHSAAKSNAPRVGIAGVGAVGEQLLRSLRAANATVAGIADPNRERALQIAAREGCEAYSSHQELLENQELDALFVSGPPAVHYSQVLEAIGRGIAVLCEKPFALNSAQAKEMVAAANEANVVLMVDFPHRQYEPTVKLRSMLESGDLGELISFHVRFDVDYTREQRRWIFRRELAGGGCLTDSGSHGIDLFRDIAGEVVRVGVMTKTFTPALDVEDSGVLLMEGKSGTLGVIQASWRAPGTDFRWSLHGTRGVAYVTYEPPGYRLRLTGDVTWSDVILPESANLGRFDREVAHFIAVLDGRERARGTGYDGLRSIEILEAGYRSSLSGQFENCAP
jgi:predicted dehydrogenase